MNLSARLYRLANTPSQRKKRLDPSNHALWDRLQEARSKLKDLGYRMTASGDGNVQLLFKDTDVRVTLRQEKALSGKAVVKPGVFSPTWHRPPLDVGDAVKKLERQVFNISRYTSWDLKDRSLLRLAMAYLSELAPLLDDLNKILETPEVSSE